MAMNISLREAAVNVVGDEPLEGYDRVYVDDAFGNRIDLMEPKSNRGRAPG
jgi:hypothetical protein